MHSYLCACLIFIFYLLLWCSGPLLTLFYIRFSGKILNPMFMCPHTENSLHCSPKFSSPFLSPLLSASLISCSSSWLWHILYIISSPVGGFLLPCLVFQSFLLKNYSLCGKSQTFFPSPFTHKWTADELSSLLFGEDLSIHDDAHICCWSPFMVQGNAILWPPTVDSWCRCHCCGTVFCLQGEVDCLWSLFFKIRCTGRRSGEIFSQKLGLGAILVVLVMLVYHFAPTSVLKTFI